MANVSKAKMLIIVKNRLLKLNNHNKNVVRFCSKPKPIPNGLAKYDRIDRQNCFVRNGNKQIPIFNRMVYKKINLPEFSDKPICMSKIAVVSPDILANTLDNPNDFYGVL